MLLLIQGYCVNAQNAFNVCASFCSAQVPARRLSELNLELLRQVFIHVHHTECISITLIGHRCFLG